MYDPSDPYSIDPCIISQEELDELTKLWEIYNGSNDTSSVNTSSRGRSGWDDQSYYIPPIPRSKHVWSSTLLIRTTVYTCKHCGAKQETTTSEYCNDEEF